jgi:hypothetical protein
MRSPNLKAFRAGLWLLIALMAAGSWEGFGGIPVIAGTIQLDQSRLSGSAGSFAAYPEILRGWRIPRVGRRGTPTNPGLSSETSLRFGPHAQSPSSQLNCPGLGSGDANGGPIYVLAAMASADGATLTCALVTGVLILVAVGLGVQTRHHSSVLRGLDARKTEVEQLARQVKEMEGRVIAECGEARQKLGALECAMEERTAELQKALDSSAITAAATAGASAAASFESARKEIEGLTARLSSLKSEATAWTGTLDTVTLRLCDRLKGAEAAQEQFLWPTPFLTDGKLAPWKLRVTTRLAQRDAVARELFGLLVEMARSLDQKELDRDALAATLDRLSECAHRFWKGEAAADGEFVTDASRSWSEEFNRILGDRDTGLQIRIIHPRERFDMVAMLAISSRSGNNLVVHEVLSWSIWQRSGEDRKLLYSGRVITQ